MGEGGVGSIGSWGGALLGGLPSVKIGEDEVEEGVIGKGLFGEGVRGTARSVGTFGFSERKCPSMTISAGKESTREFMEKAEKEPIRSMGGGIGCMVGKVRERGDQ